MMAGGLNQHSDKHTQKTLKVLQYSALSWNLSPAENLANLSLQDRATEWHYNQSSPPPPPPTRYPRLDVFYLRTQWSDIPQILTLFYLT